MKKDLRTQSKLLIIGKIPPPIGGVRIHVMRLMQHLHARGYNFDFYNLDTLSVFSLTRKIYLCKAVHLHTSRSLFQLVVAAYCRLIGKPLIITYHGNWGRFGLLENFAVKVSAMLASVPLVQNEESLSIAQKFNQNALLFSAFISPFEVPPLSETLISGIHKFRKSYRFVFCTNAWNLTFDKNRKEIYGISELIKSMAMCSRSGLIISDPSGNYQKFLLRQKRITAENILWISEPHDFINILKLSDAFIRNTTTDGTSLSIGEALSCNIPVFASNAVSRLTGVHVYENIAKINFEKALETVLQNQSNTSEQTLQTDTIEKLLDLYGSLGR